MHVENNSLHFSFCQWNPRPPDALLKFSSKEAKATQKEAGRKRHNGGTELVQRFKTPLTSGERVLDTGSHAQPSWSTYHLVGRTSWTTMLRQFNFVVYSRAWCIRMVLRDDSRVNVLLERNSKTQPVATNWWKGRVWKGRTTLKTVRGTTVKRVSQVGHEHHERITFTAFQPFTDIHPCLREPSSLSSGSQLAYSPCFSCNAISN